MTSKQQEQRVAIHTANTPKGSAKIMSKITLINDAQNEEANACLDNDKACIVILTGVSR